MSENGILQEPAIFRVMTFNTWYSGDKVKNGREKIAKHIKLVNPDVVALQEVYQPSTAQEFAKLLGDPWKVYHGSGQYLDNILLTRHKLLPESGETTFVRNGTLRNSSVGTTVQLSNGQKIVVWGLHLDYVYYGPYAMRELEGCTTETVYNCEAKNSKRAQEVQDLIASGFFQINLKNSDHTPVIVMGDFNAPSHLDYVESTKPLHNNWIFEWPTSKLLTDIGFEDSYRQVNKDPAKDPGVIFFEENNFLGDTWSTVCKLYEGTSEPEPQDRIDFIYYKGSNIECIGSKLYAGTEKIEASPDHEENDWPSDHLSVVSDFVIGPFN